MKLVTIVVGFILTVALTLSGGTAAHFAQSFPGIAGIVVGFGVVAFAETLDRFVGRIAERF